MRNQKLRDAALLLPLVGTFLLLPTILRLMSGGRWFADLPSLPAFLYMAWLALIVGAGLLSRLLLKVEAGSERKKAATGDPDGKTQL